MTAKDSDRLLSKDYILLMFSSSVHALMNQFFLVVLPLYLVKLGGTTLYAGILATVYSLTALAARPVSGVLSDKSGRVKLLILGATLSAVTCSVFGFASVLPLMILIRVITGVGFGIHSTCAGAAAADVLPKSRLAEGIGYFGLYATLAQMIGPGIAIAITAGDRISDYRALFFLTAGLCGVSIVTNCCITYERKRKRLPVGASAPESLQGGDNPENKEIGENKDVRAGASDVAGMLPKTLLGFEYAVFAPGVVLILVQTGITGVAALLASFARDSELGNAGLFYAVSAAGTLLSRLLIGKIVDRRGADVIVVPGLIVLTAFVAMIPSVRSMGMLIAFALPIGLAQGAVLPTFNSIMFRRSSPARRGTASGAYFSSVDIGYALGAPLLGALVDFRGYRLMYWAAAAFLVIALVVYLFISTDRQYNLKNANAG